ncbi:MAG: hypothetical protein K8R59_02755, partial [Thermoanaerobaculales bacterium]|nr:hypothetical protein [Thermoanaerobaculales bacterium]
WGAEPLAGVSIPKVTLKLESGEEFWIQADFSLAANRGTVRVPGQWTRPHHPEGELDLLGPSLGWFKIFGLLQVRLDARGYQDSPPWGDDDPAARRLQARNILSCLLKRGPEMQSPGSIGHSATDCPYNSYLTRPLQIGPGMVYALTGRIPTTPRTRNGEPTMEPAQARFWSICHSGKGPDSLYCNLGYGCLMDEEITVDESNDYIIVYSQGEGNRPANARPECGVTWQDFGPEARQGFPVRWMSVYPDHSSEEYVPNDANIPWETGAWAQESYDETLVGTNRPGVMGPYHPVIHYLSKDEFEDLGCPVDPGALPTWQTESPPLRVEDHSRSNS